MGKRGIPWGGGGYFRLVPYALWLAGVHAILRSGTPYIFYIHPWRSIQASRALPGSISPMDFVNASTSIAAKSDSAPLCWRFRMDADLRSRRPMEGGARRATALDPTLVAPDLGK
jgi:hypothetical protein